MDDEVAQPVEADAQITEQSPKPQEPTMMTPTTTLVSEEDKVRFAATFLRTVARLNIVTIDRTHFLSTQLRKHGISEDVIDRAIGTRPAVAQVPVAVLESIARSSIEFETRKSTAISFASGVPGGLAIAATIPADLTQYFVHTFRIMQKLAYVYGWQSFLEDCKEVDDETLGQLALFLGTMTGVSGASQTLAKFAATVVQPAVQKQIAGKALMKTVYYPVIKTVLRRLGVKITRDSFARGAARVVPLAGGVISGGITYGSLKVESRRLMTTLQKLPPALPATDVDSTTGS